MSGVSRAAHDTAGMIGDVNAGPTPGAAPPGGVARPPGARAHTVRSHRERSPGHGVLRIAFCRLNNRAGISRFDKQSSVPMSRTTATIA